jgi:hypothetical protein
VTRAEHEGSLAGITTRMVDQAKLELLDELLELRSPHDAVRRSLGMQWLRREMTERRDQLAMPAWARELSPSLSEGHRWDEEHPIIEVVDRDVVRHLRPNDR